MAITSWTTLKAEVATWLADTTLTDYIPTFIQFGELRIYRDLRIRAMETALSDTIASGVISVPSDYVELKHAYIDGAPTRKLKRAKAEFIYDKYPTRSSDAKPVFIARDVDSFIFGPYPDSAYTVNGTYYAKLTALSGSNETNWFTTNAPDLLLWAALLEAEPFLKNDERLMLWEKKYMETKDAIQAQDDAEDNSGGPIRATVDWG